MASYSYNISGSAHRLFPIETHFGLFTLEDGTPAEIPQQYPFSGPWGKVVVENVPIRETKPMPEMFRLAYLSIVESKFYGLSLPINPSEMLRMLEDLDSDDKPKDLVVGMTPYGGVALWCGNRKKQILLGWLEANEIEIEMEDFLPDSQLTLEQYCDTYIVADSQVKENLATNGLPSRDLFDKYMQQYFYRYTPIFEVWNEDDEKWQPYGVDSVLPEFEWIEESLFDGTHDKTHDGGLLNYHQAGKPSKLAVKWHIKKSEYTAYIWLNERLITSVFDKFWGGHPDAKTDIILHIDAENNKYELALFRQGLKIPLVISESAYQIIVFRSKLEHYRSENYDQPRGAWIW